MELNTEKTLINDELELRLREIEELHSIFHDRNANNEHFISKAFYFALDAHGGEFRRDGKPYIHHPIEVAKTCASYQMDAVSIACALLHDTVEDAGISLDTIEKEFNVDVREIINGLTKLGKEAKKTFKQEKSATIKKILSYAMKGDIKILPIKIFDRYHNIQSLSVFREEKQRRIAWETSSFYIPLADRLGLFVIARKMEDWAFQYVHPNKFRKLQGIMARSLRTNWSNFEAMRGKIEDELKRHSIWSRVRFFSKPIFETYKILKRENRRFDEVDKIESFNLEICVKTIDDCYVALGVIHNLFDHLPLRMRDFIHNPKINNYRSFHTVVIHEGRKVQILIRTLKMAMEDELGLIAALNDGRGRDLTWLKEIVESFDDISSDELFDLTKKVQFQEIDVYTPRGDHIKLPEGSTVLDLAYHIHTELGNTAENGLIDGVRNKLSRQLKSGMTVEIISDENLSPQVNWLNFIRTERSKVAIKRELRRQDGIAHEMGKGNLRKFLKKFKVRCDFNHPRWLRLAKSCGYDDLKAFFKDYHYGRIYYAYVIPRLIPLMNCQEFEDFKKAFSSMESIFSDAFWERYEILDQEDKLTMEFFAEMLENQVQKTFPPSDEFKLKNIPFPMPIQIPGCCMPKFGDEIVGLSLRDRGLSVHRVECSNIKPYRIMNFRNIVNAEWKDNIKYRKVIMKYKARDKGMPLIDIHNNLSRKGIRILKSNYERTGAYTLKGIVEMEVSSDLDLNEIAGGFKSIKGISNFFLCHA